MAKRPSSRDPESRPRGGRPRAVSELVPQVGGRAFARFGFVQSSIVSRWTEIVGERYAEVSAPESIRFPHGQRAEGVLTLTVSGAHAAVMQHVAPAIVERVNRFFGYPAVARVAIRQGVVMPARQRPTQAEPQPMPADLGESLRSIADPELRACLEGLAGALAANRAAPVTAIPVVGRIGRR